MKKEIYSNIKDSDALEIFFECITSRNINSVIVGAKQHVI